MIPHLITELQSFGLRFERQLLNRKGGAGPAEGGTLLIEGIPVSLPMSSRYVLESPYLLKEEDGRYHIFKDGKLLRSVEFVERPAFYSDSTEDGISYPQIALLHGKDCLATTVVQTCAHWHTDKQCLFCGINLSYESGQTIRIKTPEQIAEVAAKAKKLDSIQHIVLTTGTVRPINREISHLARCAAAIKKAAGLPIHAQFTPSPDPEMYVELKDAGVDTVGIHIESFDLETLSRVAPAKAAMGLKKYEEAWKIAVEVFGPNQVSSFLIGGLGEKKESVIRGSEFLADLGVYPFIIPLRPIPGSLMEDALPPDPETMKFLYETVSLILKSKGLSARRSHAGCVRCGACSALHAYEQERDPLICHPVRTGAEQQKAFEIRREVFVQEQNLFPDSDCDEDDAKSIHLIAELDHQVVGTVRLFPVKANGHWIGGRLAVRKGFRNTGAGELLVREAMRCVKSQSCTKFTAHIQVENVPFFSQLGWKTIEAVKEYFGKPHQLMEANLDD
jgi:radical SAM protein (TIGR04043 family)/putative N-acetyltransferase (TIGR04045 family)